MKRAFSTFLSSIVSQAGFTMIELLVVIAVIGVLAVAVLSSINPIEQIQKGRDTGRRSDMAQLINAADRYFAIHEYYPWNIASTDYTPIGSLDVAVNDANYANEFAFDASNPSLEDDWDWLDELVTTAEVKEGFTNRLKDYNAVGPGQVSLYKEGISNATMYACFKPASQGFKREAADNCRDGVTPDGLAIDFCATIDGTISDDNYICLP